MQHSFIQINWKYPFVRVISFVIFVHFEPLVTKDVTVTNEYLPINGKYYVFKLGVRS